MSYVRDLGLKNFTCFEDAKFQFCNGINLLLGRNGVGKTHVLKLLFAYAKANIHDEILSYDFQEKVEDTFFIENITSFCRDDKDFTVNVRYDDYTIKSKSQPDSNFDNRELYLKLKIANTFKSQTRNAIYLPPVDILTQFRTYRNYEDISKLRLDATFKYLTDSLIIPKVINPSLSRISSHIAKYTGCDIDRDEIGFYQDIKGKKTYSSLLADGLKKILTIKYLIDNNELNSNTLLFIDEPEIHLNPALLNQYSETLFELAEVGVQIFLTTHDYLLIYLLSLKSEYSKSDSPRIKFFNLFRDTENPTKIEAGNTISDLNNVSIIQEYENLFDIEQSYFFNDLKSDDNN